MRLLVDLGNTRIKWRWWRDGELLPGGSAAHGENSIGDLATPLSAHAARLAHISAVARPEVRDQLEALLTAAGIEQDWLRSPARGLGLVNSYALPHKLGIDRWLALAAAHAESGEATCVIDIGTAITVDICDPNGQHQGGLIAPGPQALAHALKADTSLPDAAADWPEALTWAQDTEDALQYGALHAACGLIERSFRQAHRDNGCEFAWLTGGPAERIGRYLDIPYRIDQELVFKGLALHAASMP